MWRITSQWVKAPNQRVCPTGRNRWQGIPKRAQNTHQRRETFSLCNLLSKQWQMVTQKSFRRLWSNHLITNSVSKTIFLRSQIQWVNIKIPSSTHPWSTKKTFSKTMEWRSSIILILAIPAQDQTRIVRCMIKLSKHMRCNNKLNKSTWSRTQTCTRNNHKLTTTWFKSISER